MPGVAEDCTWSAPENSLNAGFRRRGKHPNMYNSGSVELHGQQEARSLTLSAPSEMDDLDSHNHLRYSEQESQREI